MKKLTILLFSLFTVLTSCNDANLYSKFYDDFPSNRWESKNAKEFEFTITDSKAYDVFLKFGHVYDYQYESVPITITIIDPAGKEEKCSIDLVMKDASGKDLADCSGDVCDLELKIKEKVKLQKGNYKIIISHAFKQGPYLPNVLGVGLNVAVAK
ncbi:hypothetical protein [Flavobacterium sp. GT3R68]|uniref:hypothetical protein n=1 Tax=Flavobacterium sp. GT3R68 TaxID=2594437 RepID=UPI000F88E80B|nr:hypothetical protein [Flavobacterium sp. GT3R68]RTY90849.1 hypothetical protein EKL32_20175 [Flavobacterium sp. GSN2]TRW93842.1 hypothetical protein FNW07_02735 [Flavobacterium sp. GT3R68]